MRVFPVLVTVDAPKTAKDSAVPKRPAAVPWNKWPPTTPAMTINDLDFIWSLLRIPCAAGIPKFEKGYLLPDL